MLTRARIIIGEDTPEPRTQWVTLPAPLWEGREDIRTGETLRAIYHQPRLNRWIVATYSAWENRTARPAGQVVGLRYYLRTPEEVAQLVSNCGIEWQIAHALRERGIVLPTA